MELKHSGLGIASFVVSIVMLILMFVLFAVAGMMHAASPGGIDEQSFEAVILGLGIFAGLFLCLVALGMGIAAMFEKERRKLFAVLGSTFSAGTIAFTILLMVLGNM